MLLANGKKVAQAVLSNKNSWKYTFKNLPVNDKGKAIVYTIIESNVPSGYKASYDQSTLTVTNTHKPYVADLSLKKSVDKKVIKVGDTVTYTFTVTNNGPDKATGVFMIDKDILQHEFVSSSSKDYDPSTGKWTIGELADGESIILTVTVRINEVGEFTNTAFVYGDQHDGDPLNNNDSVKIVVIKEEPPVVPDKDVPKEVSVLPPTGNPLLMLLIALIFLGFGLKRRED